MASLAARQVARDVLGSIGKGKRPNITQIAVKNGYSYKTANAGIVQTTKSYKDEINTALDKMIVERDRILNAMSEKNLSKERYDTLARTASSLTHDTQLLSGGKTENVSVEEDRRILIGIVAALRNDVV